MCVFALQDSPESEFLKSPSRSPSNSPDLKRKFAALVEPPATRSKSGIRGSPTKKMAEALQSPVRGGKNISSYPATFVQVHCIFYAEILTLWSMIFRFG